MPTVTAESKFWWGSGASWTHWPAKQLALPHHFQKSHSDGLMASVHCCHCCMFALNQKPEQKWPRCRLDVLQPPVAPCARAFFPWRPVRKRLFPCCCLAFLWRPIGMRCLVAAVCKNRKQSRQPGVKQIHMTPNSVFSLFISPCLLSSSLALFHSTSHPQD